MPARPAWYRNESSLVQRIRSAHQHWGHAPRIAGYDRLFEVRRGGQGVIYRATQVSTGRTVAIKVLLDGALASESNRLRFEREFDAVARLRHADIVSVFDRGTTAEGFCYYVMEYVEGVAIDDPVAREHGCVRATLSLIARVADAVQHAHQRGVVHRDLKPANVLIDGEGHPHILDFGLAKPVDRGMADVSTPTFTQTGEFLGSLAWASPEQLELHPDRVDSRTDVYSLGVILYQLLTGRSPYPPRRTLRGALEAISVAPPVHPGHLRRDLPDDVSTIVLRCLAKEPARRYQTPGELAEDVRRFLAGRPINAKRDRTGYVLRKLVARHPGVAGSAVMLLVVMLGFGVTMSLLYRRATVAERLARARLQEAHNEAAKNDAVRDFVTSMLSQADPAIRGGASLSVRELLDASDRSLGLEFADHPEIEAEVRVVNGLAYLALGHLDEAERNLRRALDLRIAVAGRGSPEAAEVLAGLGRVALQRRDYTEGEALLNEAIDVYEQTLGAECVELADCLVELSDLRQAQFHFDEALGCLERARAIYLATMGADDDPVLETMLMEGVVHLVRGTFDEGRKVLQRALAVLQGRGEANESLRANMLARLGLAHLNLGDPERAESLLSEAVAVQREVYGDRHPRLADFLLTRGKAFELQAHYERAADDYQRAREVGQAIMGCDTPEYARATWNLGMLRWREGERESAQSLLEEAIARYAAVHEPDHHFVGASLLQYGLLLAGAGEHEEAQRWLQRAVDTFGGHLGAEHAMTLRARRALGECLIETGHFEQAERQLLPPDGTGESMDRRQVEALVRLYEAWGRAEQAAHYRALLGGLER